MTQILAVHGWAGHAEQWTYWRRLMERRKWPMQVNATYTPECSSKLISKSAKMTEIGRTLLFPFQMTCIDSKVSEVIPIHGIMAYLEINLDEFSGV